MISCDSFRTQFHASTEEAELLAHVRECDRCLDFAAAIDPDIVFRSLGGDMIPPGGVDAFVGDVMRQVSLRQTENTMRPANVVRWPRRLAVAATIAVGITGATLVYRVDAPRPAAPGRAPIAVHATPVAPQQDGLATKPVVETYQSETATILEVPNDETDEIRIVMIFDESLPVDL